MLDAKGYATGAVIANSVIYAADSNFQQGFDVFEGIRPGGRSRRTWIPGWWSTTLSTFSTRAAACPPSSTCTPWTHVPYAPPAPFDTMFDRSRRPDLWRGPALRLQGAPRPRPPDRAIRRGHRLRGSAVRRFVDGLKQRGSSMAPSSSSWAIMAKFRITTGGSTVVRSSTS
jgi:hypothetical protein